MTTVATGIGSGIRAGGNFYTKHTESGDSGEVDEKTKERIETTKKVGGCVASGTSKAIGGLAKGARWTGEQTKKGRTEKVIFFLIKHQKLIVLAQNREG